jgi:glyoxylase-like metal-dependent hydrolase (beta-lactamase superfamily II)
MQLIRESGAMSEWRIGDLKVVKVVEHEDLWKGHVINPMMNAENVLKEADWLVPHFANEEGRIRLSFHSLIVESGGLRILIDTCVGDDKQRDSPRWNMRHFGYLTALEKAGYSRESIDRVICTHMHVDHVGWNTMLENGRWVPTFPKARYLLSRREWDYWSQSKDKEIQLILDDSVRPVIDAGAVDWIEGGHRVTREVATEPTPGHSPGHMSVRISSNGHEGVVTGDLIHHPIQCGHPEWKTGADLDADLGCATRRSFLARCADERTLCLGTHFATPTAGRIVRRGDAFRFEG